MYALRDRWSLQLNLPLHLTDAVTLAAVAALWRPQSALLAVAAGLGLVTLLILDAGARRVGRDRSGSDRT